MFSASTMDPIISAFSGLVLVVTLALFVYRRSSKSGLLFPPGPEPKFFSGNLDDIPKSYAWHGYAAMGKKFGAYNFCYQKFELTTTAISQVP